MSFDPKRTFESRPFLMLMRPLAAGVARLDAALRTYPRVAKTLDSIAALWHKLVESFCETIDPYLESFFPDVRLVGVVTASGDIELHRITKGVVAGLGLLSGLELEIKTSLQQMKWSAIELRLRPDQVLQRTLSLPTTSRDFLGPIIEHRLERLTPWRPDKVLYGYRLAEAATDGANAVNVALMATSKDIVESLIRRLSEAGLTPTRIGANDGPLDEPMAIDLQKNGAVLPRADSRRIVSRLAMTILGVFAIAAVATAWIASSAADDQEATNASLIKARRVLKVASMANIGGREKILLDAKDPAKAMVVLVDHLAGAIPEDTFLKELTVTSDKVRLVGSSLNAPALVGKLEAAGLINVRFSAAVTREKNQRDSFEITADRVAPLPEGGNR